MNFERLTVAFRDNPLPALVAIQMLAIGALFWMLVRSLNARATQAQAYFVAAEKFRELSQRMLEAFEDEASVRTQRAKRRAAAQERTGEYSVPGKPTPGGT